MKFDEVKTLYDSYLFQNYGREALCIARGEREMVYDLDGKEYIDFVAGIAVNCLGHNHPAIVKAISEQAGRMIHVSNLYYTKEQAELGEALASITPVPNAVSMFCNSGAEANEAALKLAVKHTKKSRVVTCWNSFHGRTSASLSATAQPKYQEGYEPLLSKAFDYINYDDVEALKAWVTSNTAAVLLEVIQGEAGVIPASTEFIKTARDLCDEKGAMLIIDEVQTGMGRTGRWFGFEHYGIEPDIVSMAKGLGGGVPIGAIVARRDVAKTFTPGSHGTTFGGNPLACAAANAVITTMKEERLVERTDAIGSTWKAQIETMVKKHTSVKAVRGKGLMIGIEMGDKAKEFQKEAFCQGMLINVAGGKTVRLVPPLIVRMESISKLNRCLGDFLSRQ
ncbi:MAG: Glutamate-1-semialdehyde 2,1-aminomutase [Methanomassiliicoccales archaeon PtaU1.Bin124]|nr:MAG: Glutamate-1-semialdehyde 2,1-aminomutase [Methanomassiliicoccales archaeon PtaU1.Bin124]